MSDAPKTLLSADDLLMPGFMRKLDRLRMCSPVSHPGASMGERVSRSRGSGMEFADHKEYSPGDDFRMIDWNVYARLDEFVVKVFETEENLSVCILLDVSASMDFPSGTGSFSPGTGSFSPKKGTGTFSRRREKEPVPGEKAPVPLCPGRKWATAARLAAALGYVALVNRDALTMFLFADRLRMRFDAARGRGHLRQMLHLLGTAAPAGQSDFRATLRAAGMQLHRPGVCFVISDFCAADRSTSLGPGSLSDALKGLVYYGHEVAALHVVDPLEADPGLEGELDVEDAETGELVPVTVKGDTVRRYREAFEKRCHAVAGACATYDAKYVRVSTTDPIENTILRRLRREGMIE